MLNNIIYWCYLHINIINNFIVNLFRHFLNSKKKNSFFLKTPSYINIHKGKDFLIILNGPSILQYKKKLIDISKKKNIITITCNKSGNFIYSDYNIFVNRRRFLTSNIDENKSKKILLSSYFDKSLYSKYKKKFSIESLPNEIMYISNKPRFYIRKGIIYHSKANGGIISILTAVNMGANNIYIAGMDGHIEGSNNHFYNEIDLTSNNIKYDDLNNYLFLKQITSKKKELNIHKLKIITPTKLNDFYEKFID